MMSRRRRDEQLVRLLLLARRLWYAEERERANDATATFEVAADAWEAEALRAVLHDALLDRYGRDYEEVLAAASQRRSDRRGAWFVTFWPRMLLFAERGFPGWSEKSCVRGAGVSPIRYALASGSGHPTGKQRSVLLLQFPSEYEW